MLNRTMLRILFHKLFKRRSINIKLLSYYAVFEISFAGETFIFNKKAEHTYKRQ